jgi:hypothetical protein
MTNEWKATEINEGQPQISVPISTGYSSIPSYSINLPKPSNYTCYMFGSRPGGSGISYNPSEGQVPNRFVRFMMRICFGCLWVKNEI